MGKHKWLLYGGLGVAALLAYAYYRSQQGNAAASNSNALGADSFAAGSTPDLSAGGVLQSGPAVNPAGVTTPDISMANVPLQPLTTGPMSPAAAVVPAPSAPLAVAGPANTIQKHQQESAQLQAQQASTSGPLGYINLADQVKAGA